jgi:hypothetical protein
MDRNLYSAVMFLTVFFIAVDSIYVRVYEERMDLLRAVILGAPGTPYHDGLFVFDLYLPPEYPHTPPVWQSSFPCKLRCAHIMYLKIAKGFCFCILVHYWSDKLIWWNILQYLYYNVIAWNMGFHVYTLFVTCDMWVWMCMIAASLLSLWRVETESKSLWEWKSVS